MNNTLKLIAEMEKHIRLVVEYQTWAVRHVPRNNVHYELKYLLAEMLEWVNLARLGDVDLPRALKLISEDEPRVFEQARQAINPYADVYTHAWYERYCERMADND